MPLYSALDDGPPSMDTETTIPAFDYRLKLEIGVQEGQETVPAVSIFSDLIFHLREAAHDPVIVKDMHEKVLSATQPVNVATFKDDYGVETVDAKIRKVILGFRLLTPVPLMTQAEVDEDLSWAEQTFSTSP